MCFCPLMMSVAPRGRRHSGVRDFSSRAILDDKHDEILIPNRIDNPIIALANPIEVVPAFEFRDARGARSGAECPKPLCEKFPIRFRQCMELLRSWRSDEHCGNRLMQSEPQFFQNEIQRLGALLVRLG
jgi:hypothetical protein